MKIAQQRGFSLLDGLLIVILIGFFASIGFKLFPHYMDNKSLAAMITAVDRESGSGVQVRNVAEFYAHINKNMQVNNIRDLNPADIMDIRSEGPDFYVHVKYEAREKVLKNISLIVDFDQEYRVRNK